MVEQVAKFLLGGLVGYAWERAFAPQLPGCLKGVPFRPIYGFGAVCAQDSLGKNIALSMIAEKLGNLDGKLWHYDESLVQALDSDVRADYATYFGEAMTSFEQIWKALTSKRVIGSRRE